MLARCAHFTWLTFTKFLSRLSFLRVILFLCVLKQAFCIWVGCFAMCTHLWSLWMNKKILDIKMLRRDENSSNSHSMSTHTRLNILFEWKNNVEKYADAVKGWKQANIWEMEGKRKHQNRKFAQSSVLFCKLDFIFISPAHLPSFLFLFYDCRHIT